MPPIIQLLVALMVVVAGIYDIRYRRIPNWLVLPAVLLGFALNTHPAGLAALPTERLFVALER